MPRSEQVGSLSMLSLTFIFGSMDLCINEHNFIHKNTKIIYKIGHILTWRIFSCRYLIEKLYDNMPLSHSERQTYLSNIYTNIENLA